MKNRLLIILIGCTSLSYSQVNPTSNAGSIAHIAAYNFLRGSETRLNKNMKDFLTKYSERGQYILAGLLVSKAIKRKLEDAKVRALSLGQQNNALSFLYYSKKKENIKYLVTVHDMLNNLIGELYKSNGKTAVYGERLNLHQNTMRSLTKINRQMDVIEGNIGKSVLTEVLVKKDK